MNNNYFVSVKAILISTFFYHLTIFPSNAQITSDLTLPQNTTIRLGNNTTYIEGGSQSGSNLFHSFDQFSVSTGSTAYFNNAANIQNIISRVTGKSVSNIDGLVRANGTANLFLINQNGITFGQNARLDIGGSFVATTANAIKFPDGLQYSSTQPQSKALLSINIPIELQFEGNNGRIEVKDTGYIFEDSDFRIPLDASKFSSGLQVTTGKTLALVGGEILLDGGLLSNRDGTIDLISIDQGIVNIEQQNNKLLFNSDNNVLFKDINLLNYSLIYINSISGEGKTINLQGHDIKILGGSSIFSQNQGYKLNGEIVVTAFNNLELKDSTPLNLSAIYTSNFGNTAGEGIDINADKIVIEGAQIAATTFTHAASGNVFVNVNDYLKITGSAPSSINPFGYGGINTFSYNFGYGGDITAKARNLLIGNNGVLTTSSVSSGQGGNLDLTTDNLVIIDGGNLGTASFGTGNSGNVSVNASNYIELLGESVFQPSSISATTFGYGDAGNVSIRTPNLFIREGASVSTDTVSYGNAGDININASNSIEVSGFGSISTNPSTLTSSAYILTNESLRAVYNVPPYPLGNAGKITLNTKYLNVTNNALISVLNNGLGNAGKLQINTNTVNVTNNAVIAGISFVGEGGDIGINSKIIQLRSGSISTTAGIQGGTGNGGNIDIFTDILAAASNSNITANAYEGRGGNIQIDTRALVISPDTQITASSQKGINGTVEINFQQGNLTQVKAQLEAIAQTPQITSPCQNFNQARSSFVNSSSEGMPAKTTDSLISRSVWQPNSVEKENNSEQPKPSTTLEPTTIVEAQGWMRNAEGDIILVAQTDPGSSYASASSSTCYAQPSTAQVLSETKTGRE